MLDLLFDLGELFLSWRLYVGLALTTVLCLLICSLISQPTAQLVICIPIGLLGIVMSFRWQIQADQDD